MTEKILKALKTKHKNLGLGDNILKVYAEKLAKTVKDESEIDAVVEESESDLRIYQSLADQNRTLQKKIQELEKGFSPEKEENPQEKEKTEKKPETQAKGEEIPSWAQAIIQSNKELSENLQALQTEKIQKSNAEKLTSKLKELGVNENFYRLQIQGKNFENEEQIELFAIQLKEAQDAYNQSLSNEALKTQQNPLFGTKSVEGQVSADVQNFINQNYAKR